MKTVFIINPKAGKGSSVDTLSQRIREASADAEIYVTRAPGDAERFVREYDTPARFIACGGDGTFSEVVNGASEIDEVGVLPIGTGNDFCRNFTDCGDFESVLAQIEGETIPCDAIFYRTVCDGEERCGHCANMFNIGFDCNVADMTANMKKKPFISGSLAYLLSIFAILIKKKGEKLKIELDSEEIYSGALLLTSIANGSFCGGGIKSNPVASVNDGFANVNIVHNISRINFLTKLPFYMKGTHIKLRNIEKIISNHRCKKIVITPLDGNMRLCIDGEIITAGKCKFEIIPGAFNFVLPAKLIESEMFCK